MEFMEQFNGRKYKPSMKNEMKQAAGVHRLTQCALNIYWTRFSCGVTCKAVEKDFAHFYFHSATGTVTQRLCAALKAGQLFVSWFASSAVLYMLFKFG